MFFIDISKYLSMILIFKKKNKRIRLRKSCISNSKLDISNNNNFLIFSSFLFLDLISCFYFFILPNHCLNLLFCIHLSSNRVCIRLLHPFLYPFCSPSFPTTHIGYLARRWHPARYRLPVIRSRPICSGKRGPFAGSSFCGFSIVFSGRVWSEVRGRFPLRQFCFWGIQLGE